MKRDKDNSRSDVKDNEVEDEKKPIQRNPPDLGKFLNTFTLLMGLWILFIILSQRTSEIKGLMN